jgi:hydrogenase nickel incorporation protein HypA/HybF
MHEGSVGHNLLHAVLRLAGERGAARVGAVRARVGGLHPPDLESVRFHFERDARGTPAEGASLEIEPVPPSARCLGCREMLDFAVGAAGRCPHCGSSELEAVIPPEVEVIDIETQSDVAA